MDVVERDHLSESVMFHHVFEVFVHSCSFLVIRIGPLKPPGTLMMMNLNVSTRIHSSIGSSETQEELFVFTDFVSIVPTDGSNGACASKKHIGNEIDFTARIP